MTDLIPLELIERIADKILLIRGVKVMLDRDLAKLYGVETRVLTQAVRRNLKRFPADFMFLMEKHEVKLLMSQSVISKPTGRGGTRKPPMVFTEQGVAMLSSVLRSDRAIQVNIAIMRAFMKLREIVSSQKSLAGKLVEMENRLTEHDENFQIVFEAIRQLLEVDEKPKRQIGF